jgi:hydroxymethylglutaryl-CoA lyase
MPSSIRIVEVSPRDGLQNENRSVPTEMKARLVRRLLGAGLREIELTSFVSPKWVPQLADASDLSRQIGINPNFSALVPNLKGLEGALKCGYSNFAFFTAASQTFCKKNINMSLEDSLDSFRRMVAEISGQAVSQKSIRAYISTAFECPYEGKISPERVVDLTKELFSIGVDEVSLADTIGVAGPTEVEKLARLVDREMGLANVAFHFHDTHGTALANVAQAIASGVRIFDSSAAGLGGCPYAPGAGGNLATEDLVYFLAREGYESGVDLRKLAEASLEVLQFLARVPSAKAQTAALSSEAPSSSAK